MHDNIKNRHENSSSLSRRQFIKGGIAAASITASVIALPGCSRPGLVEEDLPVIPENNVDLPSNGKSVLILGGGFGGMHLACELLDRGFDVTVIEKSNMLGGKLKSWRDKDFGIPPESHPDWRGYPRDHGIHGIWGCYKNLREFMGRHGYKQFKFPNDATTLYHFLSRDGAQATMIYPPPDWPGLLGDFQRYFDMIGAMEKMSGRDIGLAPYLLKLMSFDFNDEKQRMYLDSISFPAWARSMGMPEQLIYRFMGPFADMAMLDQIDNASALYILIIMHLLLGSLSDMHISLFMHPPGETYVAPIANYIESRGGKIIYNTPVTGIKYKNGKIQSVLAGSRKSAQGVTMWKCRVCGEDFASPEKPDVCPFCGASSREIIPLINDSVKEYHADYYVAAMDTPGAKRLVSSSDLTDDAYFDRMMKLDKTDVCIVDIWYSHCNSWETRFPGNWNFMPSGFRYLGFTLNWAMDGKINGRKVCEPLVREYQPEYLNEKITVIETQIADTDKVENMDSEQIVRAVHEELKMLMPDLPEPTDSYINRWDTYSPQRVGYEANRPSIQSPVDNLFFIGDWVKTDHLSVYMEKAVVSAKMVTNLLLEKIDQKEGRMKILQSHSTNTILDLCKRFFSIYP